MIIVGAVTIASIGSDIIKKNDLAKKSMALVSGIFEEDKSVKSIEDYLISRTSNESATQNEELTTPKTVTDFTLSALFNNYQSLKIQSLNTFENVDLLTTTLAEQTTEFTKLPNKYSILNLKTFPDYEKEKAKYYGNEFAKITEKYFKQQFFIEEEDSMKYIKTYANIKISNSDELAKIEIPRSISDEHLEFTNNLTKVGIALVKLAESEDDPILSAMIIKQYEEIRDTQPKILLAIANYFKKNDIIFYDDEPGAMWNTINEKGNQF